MVCFAPILLLAIGTFCGVAYAIRISGAIVNEHTQGRYELAQVSPLGAEGEDGPLDGMGRGKTLFKLANVLFEDENHTPKEVEELLHDADERWGKFHERADGNRYNVDMITKIYGEY
jgi:hypothetical protein